MKDGKAVVFRAQIEVNFRLPTLETDWHSQMAFASEAGLSPPVVTDGTLPNVRTSSQTANSSIRPTILMSTDVSNESVVLEFTVDLWGSVKNIHAIQGSKSSSELLSRHLATWKFRPAVKNNRSVEAIGRVSFVRKQDESTKAAPETTAPPAERGQIRTMASPKESDSNTRLGPADGSLRNFGYKVTYYGGTIPLTKTGAGFGLYLEGSQIRLASGKKDVLTIPVSSISEISYGHVAYQRPGDVMMRPLGLANKPQKHLVSLTWSDGNLKGGLVIECGENDYRGILVGLESVSGKKATISDLLNTAR
jgi:hypothetical protein